MTNNRIPNVLLLAGACAPVILAMQFGYRPSVQPAKPTSKSAVDRAVAYVIAKGDAWIGEKKCVSCHMVPGMVWSLTDAEAAGHRLPPEKMKSLSRWSLRDSLREDPGSEGLAQLIFARSSAGPAERESEGPTLLRYAEKLLSRQRGDGSWKPAGQTPDQKRPFPEGVEVVTMWALLALDDVLADRAAQAVAKGRAYVADEGRKLSNEWTMLRLLTALRFDEPDVARKQIDGLLKTQNKDGGWSWLVGEESDALATGQSLYALSLAPKSVARRAVARARAFLLRTQREDGSWAVKGTLSEHRNEIKPTSVFWGTTWAVIGLCRTGT